MGRGIHLSIKTRVGNQRAKGSVLRRHLSRKTGELEETERTVRVDSSKRANVTEKQNEVNNHRALKSKSSFQFEVLPIHNSC